MNRTLMVIVALSAALRVCQAREESLALLKFHEPGDRLDISIRQELERSVGLGVQWLVRQQASDGAFGKGDDRGKTALVILAFTDTPVESGSNALHRALTRLKRHGAAQSVTNTEAAAWSYAALALHGSPEQELASRRTALRSAAADNAVASDIRDLCREILVSLGQEPDPSWKGQAIPEAGTETPLLRMWLNARIINREMGGQCISRDGRRMDWRRQYARRLISTQKVDPGGGGFWPDRSGGTSIANTALAILIAKEL